MMTTHYQKRFYFVLLIALAGFFCSGFCHKPNSQNDWAKMDLEGQIERLTKRVYNAKKKGEELVLGTIVADPMENWDIQFDKKGFIQSKKCYDTNNDLALSYTYSYKKKNKLTEKSLLDANAELIEKTLYKSNGKGQCTEETIYKADNSMLVEYSYHYNRNGTLSEMKIDVPKNSVISLARYEYIYNKAGQRIGQKNYDRESNKLTQTYEYKYDNKGNRIEHLITNHTGDFTFKWTYKYNDKNLQVAMERHFNGGSLCEYQYTFDEKGNWTRKVELEKGKVVFVEERTISYY